MAIFSVWMSDLDAGGMKCNLKGDSLVVSVGVVVVLEILEWWADNKR